jgi:hypothetical protein
MKTSDQLRIAENIQEYIEYSDIRINSYIESINGYPGKNYPELREKYHHNLEITLLAKKRLEQRLIKILNSIIIKIDTKK